MADEIPYVRVGIVFYRMIRRPTIYGESVLILVRWSRETIVQDHGKAFLKKVPKYLGFCCIPNHVNYQRVIGDFYNTYNDISYQPIQLRDTMDGFEKELMASLHFVKHIFGAQFEQGLDYLKILFLYPTQILPIVCLVSKERSTGKSTFLKWLKEIFGLNMTYIKGDSFSSQFNSDWASMLLVAIDEVFFDKKEITERLKYLSTTNKDKLEQKGKDREEIDFFAKFILCSNNEDNFIQIDDDEIRFWVLKINSIKSENTEFLNQLIKEIPYFLRYLIERPFFREKSSRMWFKTEHLKTSALKKLQWKNNNRLEGKLIELFYELFEQVDDQEVSATAIDAFYMLGKFHKQGIGSVNEVRKIMKDAWKIEPQKNSLTYLRYAVDYSGAFYSEAKVGRYFTISRVFIRQKFDELMN